MDTAQEQRKKDAAASDTNQVYVRCQLLACQRSMTRPLETCCEHMYNTTMRVGFPAWEANELQVLCDKFHFLSFFLSFFLSCSE